MIPSKNLLDYLQKTPLFQDLSSDELHTIVASMKVITVKKGEFILRENEVGHETYLIKKGEVEIIRLDKKTDRFFRLGTLAENEVFGEAGSIDRLQRSASVRAIKPCTILVLSLSHSQSPALIKNIAKLLIGHMRSANDALIDGLKNQLAQTEKRVSMGRLIIYTLSTISLYILVLQVMDALEPGFLSPSVLNLPLLVLFAAAVLYMMKQSGFPLRQYGLTLNHWQRSIFEALIISIPLFLFILAYKWILITFFPSYSTSPIFDITNIQLHLGVAPQLYFITMLFYCLFAPLEELIVRGALQSSLEELFVGPDKTALAIVLSNLLFGITHVHVSLGMGFLVSVPGLVWGWLYARQRTLVGVSVSHILVGVWTIFIVGFNKF